MLEAFHDALFGYHWLKHVNILTFTRSRLISLVDHKIEQIVVQSQNGH